MNAKLETADQVKDIEDFLSNHEVTKKVYADAKDVRPFTVVIDPTGEWTPFGASVQDNGTGATIRLKAGEDVGGAVIYCLQEVVNTYNIDKLKVVDDLAKTKNGITKEGYVDQIEMIEYEAYKYRTALAEALDNDPAYKLEEGKTWQEWNCLQKGEEPWTQEQYMAALPEDHKNKIRKKYKKKAPKKWQFWKK
jgi:hypothetical protein